MKKEVILGMATLMFAGMLNTGTVSAAGTPATEDVPVSYDNRNAITDPDNPLATWSVSIPTTIAFTKTVKTKSVDVELNALNGESTATFSDTLSIDISAKSTNGMKLKADGELLSYSVTYGTSSLSGTSATKIATLKKATLKQTGTATLGNDKPTKLANFTDTLTYTITKQND